MNTHELFLSTNKGKLTDRKKALTIAFSLPRNELPLQRRFSAIAVSPLMGDALATREMAERKKDAHTAHQQLNEYRTSRGFEPQPQAPAYGNRQVIFENLSTAYTVAIKEINKSIATRKTPTKPIPHQG